MEHLLMFVPRKYIAGALLLFATALCPGGAQATTVIGTLQSVGTGDTITLHTTNAQGTSIGEQVLTGLETFTRSGGTDTSTLAGGAGSFLAFCIEPFEDAALGATYTYTVAPLANGDNSSIPGGIGSLKATQISELFGQFAPNFASPIAATQAAALQVAIWEIVSELPSNPFDVLHGNTYFSTPGSADATDMLNLAQGYLNYVTSANGTGPMAQGLTALTINGNQDMLVQVVSAAPEPGTWMMMILGFGLVGNAMRALRSRGSKFRPMLGFAA
jgi:hypothetical protein